MKKPIRATALPAIAVIIATFYIPSLNASQSEGWSVIVASNAYVTRQAATTSLSVGDGVAVGDRLRTGEGGTLVLSRGEDLVTLSEASEIIVVDPQPENTTLIVQPAGNVQYHVTKEVRPHFEVDTPLMATVVKGTTFSVSAGGADSKVTVTEGRVVAKDRRSGASSSVGAGQSGSVSTNGHGVGVGATPSNNAASSAGASNANDGNGAGASGGSNGGSKGKGGSADSNGKGGSGAGNGESNGGKGSGEHGGKNSGGGGGKGKGKGKNK